MPQGDNTSPDLTERDQRMDHSPHDIERIHARLDEIVADQRGMMKDQREMAVAQAQTAIILEGMKESLDRNAQDRAATCPHGDDLDRMKAVAYAIGGKDDPVKGATNLVHQVGIMWSMGRWALGIIVTAAVIPSAIWTARWLAESVARAVAGN